MRLKFLPLKKVLLVDDHAFLRDALALVMLQTFPDAQVLQAGDLVTTRLMLQAHGDVDLVLLDLALPDGDGLQALPGIRHHTQARIVVMSADERRQTVLAALEAGACGFLPKTLPSADMLTALRRVLEGVLYVPHLSLPEPANPPRASGDPNFSPRQREVLALLVVRGTTNKEIARELGIAESTVKAHLTAIFEALGVSTRIQVLVEVARRGLRVDPYSRGG